jgi:hypothetical protein
MRPSHGWIGALSRSISAALIAPKYLHLFCQVLATNQLTNLSLLHAAQAVSGSATAIFLS